MPIKDYNLAQEAKPQRYNYKSINKSINKKMIIPMQTNLVNNDVNNFSRKNNGLLYKYNSDTESETE